MSKRISIPSFWTWLVLGIDGPAGLSRVFRPTMYGDFLFGTVAYLIVGANIDKVADQILLPASSIFFAIAVAWANNVMSLATSKQIFEISKRNPSGIAEYVYPFQLSMLVMLFILGVWGAIAVDVHLGLIDKPLNDLEVGFLIVIFGTISAAIRIVWQTINLVTSNIFAINQYDLLIERQEKGSGPNPHGPTGRAG